ncbi:unnamed protein product [Ascophyllum nodosum]
MVKEGPPSDLLLTSLYNPPLLRLYFQILHTRYERERCCLRHERRIHFPDQPPSKGSTNVR